MTIKRKRSSDNLPVSLSSLGGLFTPNTQSASLLSLRSDGAMDMDTIIESSSRPNSNTWNFANASRIKSSDWGYRTRKRFRDNRPDEQSIHESTLDKLFAAQRDLPHATPIATDTLSITQTTRPLPQQQKSTLHSFWKQLPAPPVRPLIFPLQPRQPPALLQLPQCDDCDAPLHSEGESMDIDMELDLDSTVESSPFACHECRRNVCGTCAVVATRRICLGCATSGGKESRWW